MVTHNDKDNRYTSFDLNLRSTYSNDDDDFNNRCAKFLEELCNFKEELLRERSSSDDLVDPKKTLKILQKM